MQVARVSPLWYVGNSRKVMFRVASYNYGAAAAPVNVKPEPLRKIAQFSLQEVENLYQKYESAGKDGKISKEELGSYLEPLGVESHPNNVDSYFKIFHKGDNTVCLKEFVSTTTTCVHENEEKLAEIQFKIWDSDNSGKLSQETYLQMLPYVNSTQLDEKQIRSAGKEIFHLLDSNNRGFIELNDYKRGIYISRQRFGAYSDTFEKPKSEKPPLIRWSRWNSWDFFFLGTGMVASLLMFT